MDGCHQAYGLPSSIHGLSHGLKIARPLSIFAQPLAGPPFRVLFFRRTNKKQEAKASCFLLVRRKGLEPLTYWFVASHSIQLSYRRIDAFVKRLNILA